MRSLRFPRFLTFLLLWLSLVAAVRVQAQGTNFALINLNSTWRYNHADCLDGVAWTNSAYDDSAGNWLSGPGGFTGGETRPEALLGVSTTTVPAPNSGTRAGRATYFRTRFTLESTAAVSLVFSNRLDDNAAFYLNGRLVQRVRLTPSPLLCLSFGDINPYANSDAVDWDIFTLSPAQLAGILTTGTNTLAVEVHQNSSASSDMVFACSVTASIVDTNPPPTLRMPPSPPVVGYALSNAFESLTFSAPICMAMPPGETNRLFVLERSGRVTVITNLAAPNRTVFMDISSRVITGGEEGLLGLAFHPGYATNRYFYLFYSLTTNTTGVSGRHQRVARFETSPSNPNAGLPATEQPLITQFDDFSNHNGGDLHFGNDGYLYVSLGDEGDQNDTGNNSQRIDKDFFSGILRLDVDKRATNLPPTAHASLMNMTNYFIPSDNPWVGATTFNGAAINVAALRAEFWIVGLRNPWRMSFDRPTGTLYIGDVGGGAREEVNVGIRGANYGWAYREGTVNGPKSAQTPANFSSQPPILEYAHGSATNQGNSITGGVLYRGSRLPGMTGRYVFSDYVSGHVWALTPNGTNTVPFEYLFTDANLVAFGLDPSNGDVLAADIVDGQIKRLTFGSSIVSGTPLPPTLYDTGALTNMLTLASPTAPLTPNTGVLPYEVNVPFWSDNAHKTRWFFNATNGAKMTFNATNHWTLPAGMAWVKHFDLEMTNGVPSSARRLETRILVRNAGGMYGVTYRWGNSLTNATLVPDSGLDEAFTINDGGTLRTQVWHYPGRGECLTCHTPQGGWALGFSTAQLNRDRDYGAGAITNQLLAMSRAGYFTGTLSNINSFRAMAPAHDESSSLEWRVRSYLAANCASCHVPGGSGLGGWNAALTNTMSVAGIINGLLSNTGGDPSNRVAVPGDLLHSMLLTRIATRGPGQMPPLSTTVVDAQAVTLVSRWITNDLPSYRTFTQWQMDNFGSTNAPNALATADADLDGARNYQEYLAGTGPNDPNEAWRVSIRLNEDGCVEIPYPPVPNRGLEVQWTTNLFNPLAWRFLDVPENRPHFSSTNAPAVVSEPFTNAPSKFYRGRIYEH